MNLNQHEVRLKVLPLAAAGGLLAHLLTVAAFRRRTDEMTARLEHASVAENTVSRVPSIIQSFTQNAIHDPVPNTVWLSQRGEMRPNPGDPWRQFTAEQVIRIPEPSFAWPARIQMGPLVSARILDCYVEGEGLLEARLFGSARLASAAASRSELMRYLAEPAWAPHNPKLSWREIDAATAEVSAVSPAGKAQVRLIFENGDITRVEADDRPRIAGRCTVPTRCEGRCCDYRELDRCRIPTRGVASWLLEGVPFEYWRGQVTEFRVK